VNNIIKKRKTKSQTSCKNRVCALTNKHIKLGKIVLLKINHGIKLLIFQYPLVNLNHSLLNINRL